MSVTYKINGKRVTPRQWAKRKGLGITAGVPSLGTVAYSDSKPLRSEALGVMPSQVEELRQVIKEKCIPGARVLDDGAVELTSRAGRRELMNHFGVHDNDAGYSDG